jgi:hypothetical protein
MIYAKLPYRSKDKDDIVDVCRSIFPAVGQCVKLDEDCPSLQRIAMHPSKISGLTMLKPGGAKCDKRFSALCMSVKIASLQIHSLGVIYVSGTSHAILNRKEAGEVD